MNEKLVKITTLIYERQRERLRQKTKDKKQGKGELNGSEWLRVVIDKSK